MYPGPRAAASPSCPGSAAAGLGMCSAGAERNARCAREYARVLDKSVDVSQCGIEQILRHVDQPQLASKLALGLGIDPSNTHLAIRVDDGAARFCVA